MNPKKMILDLYDGLSSASSSATNSRATSPQHSDRRRSSFDWHRTSNNNCDTTSYSSRRGGFEEEEEEESTLGVLATVVRKCSLSSCTSFGLEEDEEEEKPMEIGHPTDVRHVAHVTFDSFDGFLGLPDDFEPQVPRRPPSASTRVFGVSTESMQLSIDSRGNSVPTILLMMQSRLYQQGGLQSEGIFRINPGNAQEEHVREQLNNGVIPDNIDVHCLAGLIKSWFRELPNGILDSLLPEQVMDAAQSEDECSRLVKLLPPIESALLDWAVNLMADVAQLEHHSKMNARNIAMVFAPNMTKMSDPLTALMFVVQVMNFLKTLIEKALRERDDSLVEAGPTLVPPEPSNEDEEGHHTTLKPIITLEEADEKNKQLLKVNEYKERLPNSSSAYSDSRTDDQTPRSFLNSIENVNGGYTPADVNNSVEIGQTKPIRRRDKTRQQPSSVRTDAKRKDSRNNSHLQLVDESEETKKNEPNILRRVNAHLEMAETWR